MQYHRFPELAEQLGIPTVKNLDDLCDRLSQILGGSSVRLERVAADGDLAVACGRSEVTWSGARVIKYKAHPDLDRERHNVLHEIGHFLMGDLRIEPNHPRLRMFTMLSPTAIARAFNRAPLTPGAFEPPIEQRAEAFATFADSLYLMADQDLPVTHPDEDTTRRWHSAFDK